MTVGELREELEAFGDHLTVELYDEERDKLFGIDSVEYTSYEEPRVMITFSAEME